MQQDNAIEVCNLKKSFKIHFDKGNTLKEKILFKQRRKYENREVLKGISFVVKKGEAIGLIGENGCGKSTILKLLSRIIYPDNGKVELCGRVSSLLELGAGFHPDMSGLENIFINASIFGLTRKEIKDRLDIIIDFSELRDFINNPVRTYSTGMYMRLAFSVAINVNADILLIDEILGVGDVNFQAKCFKKLREIKRSGTTIVIVSHDASAIEKFCDNAIWIRDGNIEKYGNPKIINENYLDYIMNKNQTIVGENIQNSKIEFGVVINNDLKNKVLGNLYVEITDYNICDFSTGYFKSMFKVGDNILVNLKYRRNNRAIQNSVLGFAIIKDDGLNCYGTNTYIDKKENMLIDNFGELSILLEDVQLLSGHYFIDLAMHSELGHTYHHISSALEFDIYDDINEVGVARIKHRWGPT